MTPAYAGVAPGLDRVMWHMARWLTRHLGDPRLVLWVADRGGQLHPEFAEFIEETAWKNLMSWLVMASRKTWRVFVLAHRGPFQDLLCASFGVLCWEIEILPRRRVSGLNLSTRRLWQRLRREGMTVAWRTELQRSLTPHLSLSRPFSTRSVTPGGEELPERLADLVNARIVLPLRNAHDWIDSLKHDFLSPQTSPQLLHVFNILLGDAMDLMRELGQADDRRDWSYLSQPSIAEHSQNSQLDDWTVLVDLTRDAWLATADTAPRTADLVAESWSTTPYPLFRRLSLFAATHADVIPLHQAVRWLIADDGWWAVVDRNRT